MNATSFDELVTQCLLSDLKHRLLYVFVRVSAMDEATRRELGIEDEEAGFVQVQFDAQQAVEPGLKFEQVREAADAHNTDWTLCVVGKLNNADGSLPTTEQAQNTLADMRERILAGDIEDFAVLDRNGMPVMVDAEETSDAAPIVN
ncbi:MAG TPA: hypothetical protein VIN57_03770 [Magnetovibrio sp.]